MSTENIQKQEGFTPATAQSVQVEAGSESSGMPWITLLVTLGICTLAFFAYRYYESSGAASASCYRIIDMNRLTSTLLNDMVDKTASMPAEAAGSNYRTRLKSLDNEVTRLAGGCLLLRRDAVIMPDPTLDITAQVAAALNIDLGKVPASGASPQTQNAAASKAPAASASQVPANSVQIPDALGSKLD